MTIRSLFLAAQSARSLSPARELSDPKLFAPIGAQLIAIASTVEASELPITVIVPTGRQAELLGAQLADIVPDLEVILFPSWETLPHERLSPAAQTVGRRIQALQRMAGLNSRKGKAVVLMSIRAALQPVVSNLAKSPALKIQAGSDYLLPELTLKLIEYAYERVDLVTNRGEFSVRGGILDIFPTTAEHAVRMEFFGDTVEEIREFQVADQRSLEGKLAEIELFPARELMITPAVAQRAREMAKEFPNLTEMLEKIGNAIPVAGMESLAAVLTDELVPITEYLPNRAPFVLVEPARLESQAESLKQTNEEFLHAAWDAALDGSNAPIDISSSGFVDFGSLRSELGRSHRVFELSSLNDEGAVDLGLREVPSLSVDDSVSWVQDQAKNQMAVVVICRGHGTAERIMELFSSAAVPAIFAESLISPKPGEVSVTMGSLADGFVLSQSNLVVLTEDELLGNRSSYATKGQRKLAKRRGAQVDPLELKAGDYVVHEIHGVGRFLELVQRENRGQAREYLLIEYAPPKRGYPNDTLFVPTDQLDLLSRYVGGEAPVLSKMGGTDWARAKGNARKAVRKIAIDLVKLYSARMKSKGHAFAPDNNWQRELEDAFEFQETPDQLNTIEEIKRDMERPIPMDRLLAGDVGYGKTEVAVRAAFKAIQDGKQVAMLVPTTLLVRQHLETFRSRFAGYPVNIAALSRFQSAAEARKVMAGLESGALDMVIGTHRLLGQEAKFRDLGLLIIDEEQRFGVEHKEKITNLRHNVDVLAMSATPIPRTLEMAVTGIREMSTLATPPEERHPILTYIGAYNDAQVAAAIKREMIREGQVFFVHNRVASIDAVAANLAKLVPEAKIAVAHGQMPEHQLEQVVVDFWERKFDVLVSTTIIETGIDIPNANTLIVDAAENFGLSQLHQIRGRVGRSKERAYAYFFYNPAKPLTETAHDRLATIATHNELGAGMQVAMKDLEIRGAGNLLGGEQSGHMAGVGFDLYLRMIAEAVSEFRGEEIASPAELKLELPVDARIPLEYVDSERLRLEAYHKLSAESSAKGTEANLQAIFEELSDRYGKPPKSAVNLFAVTRLRQRANRMGLTDVNLLGMQARVLPLDILDSQLVPLSHELTGVRYLKSARLLTLNIPKDDEGQSLRDEKVIDWVSELFDKLEVIIAEARKSDSNGAPA